MKRISYIFAMTFIVFGLNIIGIHKYGFATYRRKDIESIQQSDSILNLSNKDEPAIQFDILVPALSSTTTVSWFYDNEIEYQKNNCSSVGGRWSVDAAKSWLQHLPSPLIGCNFIPSTAINQIEMWSQRSFDIVTIKRELYWLKSIGMNSVRVYLHLGPWEEDSVAFITRIEEFLDVTSHLSISTVFVLFDDCWKDSYKLSNQPRPVNGVHNYHWLQNPSKNDRKNPSKLILFKNYTQGIVCHFADDRRIVMWDLWNEPGNFQNEDNSLPLMQSTLTWLRECEPSQPVTFGVWRDSKNFNRFQLCNSDVISFHYYGDLASTAIRLKEVRAVSGNRPVVCTEYMARTLNSKFTNILPYFVNQSVGSFSWGFVEGKTNTIWPWGSPYIPKPKSTYFKRRIKYFLSLMGFPHFGRYQKPFPRVWFHDILWKNGTAYDPLEVLTIRRASAVARRQHHLQRLRGAQA